MAVGESWGVPGAEPADAVQAQCQIVLQDELLDHGLCWLLELLHQIQNCLHNTRQLSFAVQTFTVQTFAVQTFTVTHRACKSVCIRVCAKRAIHLQQQESSLFNVPRTRFSADLMRSMALGGSTLSRQSMTTCLATWLKHLKQQPPSSTKIAATTCCTGRKLTSWAESTSAGCRASLCLMPLGCSPWWTVFQCLMYLVLVLFQHLQHHS